MWQCLKPQSQLVSDSHEIGMCKINPEHPTLSSCLFTEFWWWMKKCQSLAVHISNVNPLEDVLEQFSQGVWLRIHRAVCVRNWSNRRGMTLSLDSGSWETLEAALIPGLSLT